MNHRYFIELGYNGKNYHGWQYQPNAISVQEILTKAFTSILREDIEITGAGRTDTGVHASFYVAHFDSEKDELPANLVYKLNCFLPGDVVIYNIYKVNSKAHARFDATSRTYHYYIHQFKDPFLNDVSYYYPKNLDVFEMNNAANILLKYVDFTSFSKLHSDAKTNNCKIFKAIWMQEKHKLVFTISADRFLRNMVRAIVGTLVDLGRNKISIEQFVQIIESKNRSNAGYSVPAQGLFLDGISYPDHVFKL